MTPMTVISFIVRLMTSVGAGFIGAEMITNLAPATMSSVGTIKRIFCAFGAVGIAASICNSAGNAIENDIYEIKAGAIEIKGFFNELRRETIEFNPFKKKKPKPKETPKPDIPKTYKAFKPKEDPIDIINEVPMEVWRGMMIGMTEKEGHGELTQMFSDMSDEELKVILESGAKLADLEEE